MPPQNSTSKASVCIRQFHNDDLPEVAAIFEYGMMLYSNDDPASRQHWADYVRKSLDTDLADIEGTYMAPGGNFWVATIEDSNGESKVAGMIAVEPKGNGEGEVRRVSVHPGYQRRGIGRKLMAHLVQWTTTHGFKTLSLATSHAEKASSVAFYTFFGFKIGDTFSFWEDPTHKMIWMVKMLP